MSGSCDDEVTISVMRPQTYGEDLSMLEPEFHGRSVLPRLFGLGRFAAANSGRDHREGKVKAWCFQWLGLGEEDLAAALRWSAEEPWRAGEPSLLKSTNAGTSWRGDSGVVTAHGRSMS